MAEPMDSLKTMLKTDLGISSTAYDERLGQYITSAKAEIEREIFSPLLYQLSYRATSYINGGPDGNRTRDLLRDRQA